MTKYLLHNSRLVRPEMEKPEIKGNHFERIIDRTKAYYDHLSTLPGIECSEELLATHKDGDWLIEGKDFWLKMGAAFVEHGSNSICALAVPVQSDEEDANLIIMWGEWMRNNNRSTVDFLNHIQQSYKLTKK